MRSGIKKFKGKNWKGKLPPMLPFDSHMLARQSSWWQSLAPMKQAVTSFATLFPGFSFFSPFQAQTPSPEPSNSLELPNFKALEKKTNKQKPKMDALSKE